MLVLTRKQQEQILIGDNVTVTILRIKGNTVRVGIEAPRDVRVVRSELGPLDEEGAEPRSIEVVVSEPTQKNEPAATEARRELILAIRQHLAGAMS